MSFVSKMLEHTSEYESPSSFWKWASYAAISAALRDNIYRSQGIKNLYPNIFVLFLADSGIQRKGAPVELCEEIVKGVKNTKVISGRGSIQGIVGELCRAETDQNGNLNKGGSAIFFAPELSAGIVHDDQNIPILTNLYDYKEDYAEHLIGRGTIKTNKIVFTMFSASNRDLLEGIYTKAAVNGGLLARTFLVTPNEFRKGNSLLDVKDKTAAKKELIDELKKVAALKGPLDIAEDAKEEYTKWYLPFRDEMKKKPDKTGIVARIHTGILKLAMILMANDLTMVLQKKHIEEAIFEGISLLPNYHQLVMSSGKSDLREASALLIEECMAANGNMVTRVDFLQRHWSDVDAETLDKAIQTLTQGDIIKVVHSGHAEAYKLSEKARTLIK